MLLATHGELCVCELVHALELSQPKISRHLKLLRDAGVLADRSHGVFNGKIFVAQDAQKTDAKQTNQSLLLSEKAVMDSKPELEIYADDVKCTHGATVGQLDEEGMFYLRSRGVPEKVARDLLVYAFASDLLTGVEIPDLKATVDAALFDKLPGSCEPADNK